MRITDWMRGDVSAWLALAAWAGAAVLTAFSWDLIVLG